MCANFLYTFWLNIKVIVKVKYVSESLIEKVKIIDLILWKLQWYI